MIMNLGSAGAPSQSVRIPYPQCYTRQNLPELTISSAGVGSYIFAKRQVNADRRAKLEELREKRRMNHSMEYSDNVPTHPISSSTMGAGGEPVGPPAARTDAAGSPSQEAGGGDPAPTRHAPVTEDQRVEEKSKYEASATYRGRRGDRFS